MSEETRKGPRVRSPEVQEALRRLKAELESPQFREALMADIGTMAVTGGVCAHCSAAVERDAQLRLVDAAGGTTCESGQPHALPQS